MLKSFLDGFTFYIECDLCWDSFGVGFHWYKGFYSENVEPVYISSCLDINLTFLTISFVSKS